ncbi:MAG TPA: GNAT family N-acetyltransferase [Saprospiraceae bacterium]|nr:GNAT family N-acetyltransferase [Saprospiraceae bacterium]HPI07963.1 GNAT family N-acetyltransferase [Saprospiraceae bacterium]
MFITFQKCLLSDLELLQYVGRATYEPYYRHIWLENGLEWYMERCFGEETLTRELSDPEIEYWIGRDDLGHIAGFMKFYLHKSMPEKGESNALFLEKIYLMPDFFRKGVGQIFLVAAEQKATELHCKALWLNVMTNGPIAAYRKAGYEICGSTRFEYGLLKPEERGGFVMFKKI